MFKTRYSGGFVSQKGENWYVEIQMRQDLYVEPVGTSELKFPAQDNAVIEWGDKDKEDPLQGSSLTLTIESPSDRTYLDLYTVIPGAVRVVVSRGTPGNVFWTGCLDPEFYEEPYERYSGYDVSLTFTDFGQLQRFKPRASELNDPPTIGEYITDALSQAGLDNLIDNIVQLSSSKAEETAPPPLWDLRVRLANFTDEEGETSYYDEIIKSLLQPLGLRMIQRAGKIVIYDINYLATLSAGVSLVDTQWDAASQTLSTDKVANSVTVTFSPYGDGKLLDDRIEGDDVEECLKKGLRDVNMVVWDSLEGSTETEDPQSANRVEYIDGFRFIAGRDAGNVFKKAVLSSKAHVFYNMPILTDTDDAGIVTMYPKYITFNNSNIGAVTSNGHREEWATNGTWDFTDNVNCLPKLGGSVTSPFLAGSSSGHAYVSTWTKSEELYRTNPVHVVPGNEELKITLPVIFDCRYNPFNTDEHNGSIYIPELNNIPLVNPLLHEGKDFTESFSKSFGWVYLPVRIVVRGIDGSVWHFVNKIFGGAPYANASSKKPQRLFQHTSDRCYWAQGEGDWNECFLCYYDFSDRREKSGIGTGSWTENRPICLDYYDTLPSSWDKKGAGEFIPLPPVEGDLTVYVGTGIGAFYNERITISGSDNNDQRYSSYTFPSLYYLRWMLYQLPKIAIVDSLTGETVKIDDIEFKGIVNEDAKEEIDIDTICGTGAHSLARGLYLRKTAAGYTPVESMTRAGRTDSPEQLLIGTLFSQYHTRCLMLSGEMLIPASASPCIVYRDAATPGSIFMMKGETMDLIAGTTDATLVEIRPDNWTAE